MAIIAVGMMSGQSEVKSVSTETQKTVHKASDSIVESDPDDPMPIRRDVPGLAKFFTSGPGRQDWPLQ